MKKEIKKIKVVNKMASITAPFAVMLLGLFIIIGGFINQIIADTMEEVSVPLKYIALGMFILGSLVIIGCIIWLIVVWKKYKNKP